MVARARRHHTNAMNTRTALIAVALFCLSSLALSETPSVHTPVYDKDQLVLPANYREWVFLSAGFDMSYSLVASPGHHCSTTCLPNHWRTNTSAGRHLAGQDSTGAGAARRTRQRFD